MKRGRTNLFEYLIVVWFSGVSLATIISLVNVLPSQVGKYFLGVEMSFILAWFIFLFGIISVSLPLWYAFNSKKFFVNQGGEE